jgi:polyphosphate kinase
MIEIEDRKKVYTNRELSWIQFNERVLEESEDRTVPLYERLRFLAIFQSNLDEFFMVRVGSLYDQTLLKETVLDSKTKMTAHEQLQHIYHNVRALLPRRDRSYSHVMKLLAEQGIERVSLSSLSAEDFAFLKLYFDKEIAPLISPQIIDKRQPFPFLKNKENYVGVRLASKSGAVRLGIIPASGHFGRLIFLPSGSGSERIRFTLAEDLICLFAETVFEKHQVLEKNIFRITRNADIDVEDEMIDVDFDYRDAMQELLKKRRKLAPVRLEIRGKSSMEFLSYLCEQFTLSEGQAFFNECPLDLSFVFALEDKVAKRRELFFQPLTPQISNQVSEKESMIAQIEKKDILFHYPYHSIKPFIDLLNEAASDPAVVSIKITLYRVAKDSKVVNALINAAENGKEVDVVVELRARFDEENNIDWSKRLEEAGCNVIYGLPGYKVHSKLLLITRKIGNRIQYITQIGTGNYNEKTAKLYTDLSLMTAKQEIGSDASVVFNSLYMGSVVEEVSHLLVAPLCFKPKVIALIDQEIAFAREGKPAQILLKMNSVTDKVLIDKLIEASCAGVKIKMLVRGICCFKPGVPGLTENIEIYSIVGRFLEHSRILVFGLEDRQKIYISSADFMTRNTERRVEVAAPIYSEPIRKKILDLLDLMFRDTAKARVQLPDGTYVHQKTGTVTINSQEILYQQAYAEADAAKLVQEKNKKKHLKDWFFRKNRKTRK